MKPEGTITEWIILDKQYPGWEEDMERNRLHVVCKRVYLSQLFDYKGIITLADIIGYLGGYRLPLAHNPDQTYEYRYGLAKSSNDVLIIDYFPIIRQGESMLLIAVNVRKLFDKITNE